MSFRGFLDCALPMLLLGETIKKAVKQGREQEEKRRCLATLFVSTSQQNPSHPLAIRLSDQRKLPIESTLEERLQLVNEAGQVVMDLAPVTPERTVFLAGVNDKSGAFAVQLPNYDPNRVLIVYCNVLEWVERETDRPLDDLLAFDEVRTVEQNDEGYVLTCQRLVGAVRNHNFRSALQGSAVTSTEEVRRQIERLRTVQCPRVQRYVDLAEVMGELVVGGTEVPRGATFDDEMDTLEDDTEYMTAVIGAKTLKKIESAEVIGSEAWVCV